MERGTAFNLLINNVISYKLPYPNILPIYDLKFHSMGNYLATVYPGYIIMRFSYKRLVT